MPTPTEELTQTESQQATAKRSPSTLNGLEMRVATLEELVALQSQEIKPLLLELRGKIDEQKTFLRELHG